MSVADDDSEKKVNIEDDSSFESFSIGSDCGLVSIQSVKDSDISETATEEDTDESDEDDDNSSLDGLDKALLAEDALLQKEEALLRKDNAVSKEEGDDSIPEKAGQTSNNQVDIKEIKVDVSNEEPNNNRTGSIVDRSPMKSPAGRPLMKKMKSSPEQESTKTNMEEKNEEQLLSPPRHSSQIKVQDVENEAMNITVEESLKTEATIVQTNDTMTLNDGNENEQQKTNKEISDRQPNRSNTPTNKQYHIPKIINVSVSIEERSGDDRSGLVFLDKGRRTLLSKVISTSPFINSELSINDEVLLINGHRIKNATKASEFLKVSAQKGTLAITAFKGKRPRESGLEMLHLPDSTCLKDIDFVDTDKLVHVERVDDRFAKSGRIKAGDILMSINGIAICQSEQARSLLQDCLQSEQSRTTILLVFNLEKLRCRLIRKLELNKKFTWNTSFNECSIEDKVGQQRRILYIQNNGVCEIVMEDIDKKKILNEEVERFAKSFTSQFQIAIGKLRESIQATKYIV